MNTWKTELEDRYAQTRLSGVAEHLGIAMHPMRTTEASGRRSPAIGPAGTLLEAARAPDARWTPSEMGDGPRHDDGSPVRLRLFGPLLVEGTSGRLGAGDFGRLKSKQILEILLAARGHPVPKDQLAEGHPCC